jgi:hypothetical protein
MIIKNALCAVVLSSALVASGCGTVIYGRTENIPISSDPLGARVTVDDQYAGTTPITVELSRKVDHKVKIEKDGYVVYETTTSTERNDSAILYDLPLLLPPLFLLTLPIEMTVGSLNKIVPDHITADLVSASNPPSASSTPAP